jgi:UDP-N-acetyl-D-glucosamine dehydrogenase
MPHFVVEKVASALNIQKKPINGSHIRVVGVAYKRNIDDIRESPALDVMGLLHERGARLSYSDPFVPKLSGRSWLGTYDLESQPLDAAALTDVDCVVIVTDHGIIDYDALAAAAPLIVDTRNAIKPGYPHVFRIGAPQPPHAAAWAAHAGIDTHMVV